MSPTPILDRQQPAPAQPWPKPNWRRGVVVGALLGLAVVFLPGNAAAAQVLPAVATFLAALFVFVVLHELGHAAAGLAVGFYRNLEDLRSQWAIDHTWQPHMEEQQREGLYGSWKKAVTRSFDWLEE